jgi:predicted nucleic acid-binding protein
MSEMDVAGFLAAFASAAKAVDIHFQWRPQLGDPGDEMVLEAAINGAASALITHNRADFEPAASRFGVRVVAPGEFLRELSS